MAGAYVSSATVSDGGSYTVSAGSDPLLVWIASCYLAGTSTAASQQYNSVAMEEREDVSTDIGGNGDPSANLSDLLSPSSGSNTLDLTWSGTPSGETGCAITLSGIDQTTPYASGDSVAYGGVESPSFTIDAVAGDVIVYFRSHASSSSSTWTDPTGFGAPVFNVEMISSPSVRSLVVWTRDVTSTLSSFTLSATSTGTSRGGVHGYAVYNESSGGGGGTILPLIIKHFKGLN